MDNAGGDQLIRLLARAAQEERFTTSLTLSVGGATICGLLVSQGCWIKEAAATIGSQATGGQNVAGAWQELNHPHGDFIHLRDARFVSGDAIVPPWPNAGMLWRGRISEITGWSLGSLSTHATARP